MLLEMGRQAQEITLAEADVIRSQALAAESQAQQFESLARHASNVAVLDNQEVQLRSDSESEMGFDALYTTAYLQTYGLPNVSSPLVPKRGEQAVVTVPATLARQRTRRSWVGGSSGFSFPIGRTGIRYRVGSFRGHPVEEQFLARIDSGTFVVTNQRVAYVGQAKSTSTALDKLLHVECYQDGLAIFKVGRETPDFYLMQQPKYALFMINWVLNQAASG